MKNLPPLPRSELEITQIVWRLGDATVRQVVDEIPEERGLGFWTVQTYLRRLEKKGYLKSRKAGRNNIYSAAVDPEGVIKTVFRRNSPATIRRESHPRFSTFDTGPATHRRGNRSSTIGARRVEVTTAKETQVTHAGDS